MKNKSNIVMLTITAVAIIVAIVALIHACNKKPVIVTPVGPEIRAVNKGGDSMTSLKGFAEQFAYREKFVADSVARVYGARIKDLQEYVIANTQTNSNVTPVDTSREYEYLPIPPNRDCPPQIKSIREKFTSPYYDADVRVGAGSYMYLTAFDTITVVWKKVKEGSLFNRKHYLQLDVSTANPDTRVYGLKAYKVPERRTKSFGVGLQVGYGFSSGLSPKPYVGIGISYNLIRL
jgi:hypothetical protein